MGGCWLFIVFIFLYNVDFVVVVWIVFVYVKSVVGGIIDNVLGILVIVVLYGVMVFVVVYEGIVSGD